MDVQAVTKATSGVVRFNAIDQARELADARQVASLGEHNTEVSRPISHEVANPIFSPAIYAQAAQYQLYTQSGVLASLMTQGAGANAPPSHEHPEEVKGVEPTQGSRIDTHI